MMVKQVKFISWLRADPPNCFPLCHMHWSTMTLSLNAKPLTDGQANTWAMFLLPECRHSVLLSTLPSLLAIQAQILVHSTALQTGHQELGLATTPVEGIPCLQHKPEGVSINTKKTQQDSRLHSRWSCVWHFYDDLPTQTCTCAKTDSSAVPWAPAGRRRWWLLPQLQRPSGFWKKGWARSREATRSRGTHF